MIWLHDNLHPKPAELASIIVSNLLRGLVDNNEAIRLKISSFWNNETRLAPNAMERLKALTRDMYHTSVEEAFLFYSLFLLLETTKKSPDYERKLFDEPLPNAKFDSGFLQIDSSWRVKGTTMNPLFAATQAQVLKRKDAS